MKNTIWLVTSKSDDGYEVKDFDLKAEAIKYAANVYGSGDQLIHVQHVYTSTGIVNFSLARFDLEDMFDSERRGEVERIDWAA